jgi:hypothetical protein
MPDRRLETNGSDKQRDEIAKQQNNHQQTTNAPHTRHIGGKKRKQSIILFIKVG